MVKVKTIIDDSFWSSYMDLVGDQVLPYQWDALNDKIFDASPSGALRNFKIAAGDEDGEFTGMVFQDSDVAKWLEAVAHRLVTHPDEDLEKIADDVIDLVIRAQQEDGYLNTFYIINGLEKKWTNLHECHELYCAGHMIEAAIAYYEATGKDRFLKAMCKFADHIDKTFGPEPTQKQGYPGHQEIELALVKLFRLTKNRKYLRLANYFLDARGEEPYYFDIEWEKKDRISYWSGTISQAPSKNKKYNQSHLPVRQQKEAVGHAVRAVYMYASMADVALETKDQDLLQACRRLWHNIVTKRMYITGGIGSQVHGEAFSFDYDLPNDTVYAETCAAIGLIFFAQRMLQVKPMGEYADVLEKALYNNVLAGMSLDGKRFFYVNPLQVNPEACSKNENFRHVKPTRQKWFGCACCPPNIARLLTSLNQYIYSVANKTLFTHLYIGSDVEFEINGRQINVKQETNYPWDGNVELVLELEEPALFGLGFRIPGWCKTPSFYINDEEIATTDQIIRDGYLIIRGLWSDGDVIRLELPMEPIRVRANPFVEADIGYTAIQRGPFVYCLEEVDNGKHLHSIVLPGDAKFEVLYEQNLLEGINVIRTQAKQADLTTWGESLYQINRKVEYKNREIVLIPYFAWANRREGEMAVWIKEWP